MKHVKNLFIFLAFFTSSLLAKTPDLDCKKTTLKIDAFLQNHAIHKQLTPVLVERALKNYLDLLDPLKITFTEEEVAPWEKPSEDLKLKVLQQVKNNDFSSFISIHSLYEKGLERKKKLLNSIDMSALPTNIKGKFFKKLPWAKNEEELLDRLKKMRSIQIEALAKVSSEMKEKSMQWIQKYELKDEEKHLNKQNKEKECVVLVDVLKAFASSLDSQTHYFTPEEAMTFLRAVQQKLFGIGVQLRDDINGFTAVKIIEGGPADVQGDLKPKDKIIAVDHEPVIGLDINEVVEKIRGTRDSKAVLTVLRKKNKEAEIELEIAIPRGDVILKESRFESFIEPFGKGNLLYLRLFSFYQDEESASAKDLEKIIKNAKKEGDLEGIIFDLRYNTGGLLSQAIDVTSLFIKNGVIASIKDNTGKIQHLRNVTGKPVWDGPLLVLVNKCSASASEIVAKSLQDYGRALIVGDEHTFGKGTFQMFTLISEKIEKVNPEGEFKVTGGVYYTAGGTTPQLEGVASDIVITGPLANAEIGEKFSKFPLEPDTIPSSVEDSLEDLPFMQKESFKILYLPNKEKKQVFPPELLTKLQKNTDQRLENSKDYQRFLKKLLKLKEEEGEDFEEEEIEEEGEEEDREFFSDFQLLEAFNILKDFILLQEKGNTRCP